MIQKANHSAVRGLFLTGTLLCAVVSSAFAGRTVENINMNWKFYKGNASGAEAVSFNDDSWSTVHLPHTFEYVDYHFSSFYRGYGWYRKSLELDASYEDKKIFLSFGAAMTVTEVWINGTKIFTHYGGFTPFVLDITDNVIIGGDNVIACRLDNTWQDLVPPEKPPELSDWNGTVDYCLIGGIYRSVLLISTDNLYVPSALNAPGGVFITTPTISTSSATINVKTVVKNDYSSAKSCVLKTVIYDPDGSLVTTIEESQSIPAGETHTFEQTANSVSNPSLWSPVSPDLYTARTEVYDNMTLVDTCITRFGIRSIRWDRTDGFFLNDEHVKLLGVNRHQMFPYLGHALPARGQYREAAILKDMGCNFIRTSHYPQHPAFLDGCDELGIMVFEEAPSWQGENLPDQWKERHYNDIRDLIRRDRNRPSIIVWGAGLNESQWQDLSFEQMSNTVAKEEDATRPTTMVRQYTVSNPVFDIYGHNIFTPPLPSNPVEQQSIGYFNAEHTGHTYAKARWDPASDLVEHARRHEEMNNEACKHDWIAGGMGWCAFDYYTPFNNYQGIAYHGVADLFRIPKPAYYFYQSQTAGDNYDGSRNPMVYILSFADYSMPSTQNIKVYSNCDEVELFVNGSSVGTRSPDNGRVIAHPAFTFSNVNFSSPGTLRADGIINGNIVATHTVRRAGSASKILLQPDTDILLPDGSDIARVVVSIVDDNETVIRSSSSTVNVSASGPGKVICGASGPQTNGSVRMDAGQLAFLVQAGTAEGTITVNASVNGLTDGEATITVGIPTRVGPQWGLKIPGQGIQQPIITFRRGTLLCDNLAKETNAQISVIAMNGRIIRQRASTGIDRVAIPVSDCPAGVYTVTIQYPVRLFYTKVLFIK